MNFEFRGGFSTKPVECVKKLALLFQSRSGFPKMDSFSSRMSVLFSSYNTFVKKLVLLTNRMKCIPLVGTNMPGPHGGTDHGIVQIKSIKKTPQSTLTKEFQSELQFEDGEIADFITDIEKSETGEHCVIYTYDTTAIGETVVRIHDTFEQEKQTL
jgi:hypothetical protein